ncbi:MAG: OB-fold nucleic acid binding domain-containing protein [Candidatus Bathyarchaeota archaeon]|nr:OB-fold nucleic acid binding domain-containing protein [Candidatus Bathyarchaeota archaeon]
MRASLNHQRNLVYLSKITVKYGFTPEKLIDYLIKAKKDGRISYKKLEFKVREKTEDFTTYTVIYNKEIVSQFRLESKLLDYPESSKHKIQELILRMPPSRREMRKNSPYKIAELRKGLKAINLKAKVIEKSPTKEVFSRNGRKLKLSNVKISDGSGNIKLTLWNEQIGLVSEGDTVKIRNANVKTFRGEKLLNVSSRSGKIDVIKK